MAVEFEIWFYFWNEYMVWVWRTSVHSSSIMTAHSIEYMSNKTKRVSELYCSFFASRTFQTWYCRCIDEMRTLVQVSKSKHKRCRCCGSRMLRQEIQTLRSSASQTTTNHLPNNFQAAKADLQLGGHLITRNKINQSHQLTNIRSKLSIYLTSSLWHVSFRLS